MQAYFEKLYNCILIFIVPFFFFYSYSFGILFNYYILIVIGFYYVYSFTLYIKKN